MDNKYININMSNQIFRNITFLRMIFFLFFILSFSKNTNGQCSITPGDTTISCGDSITLCANTTSTSVLTQGFTVTRLQDTISGAGLKANMSVGDWHYIAVTKDSQSSLEGKIYIDGQLVATGAWQNQSYSYISLNIGAGLYTGWSGFLNGWLDEVRVSNVVRLESEILSAYNNGINGIPFSVDPNTLGLWHMDETFGTTFANSGSLIFISNI